jgi:kynurenine formamidase
MCTQRCLSRRAALGLPGAVAVAATLGLPSPASAAPVSAAPVSGGGRVLDLTYPFTTSFPPFSDGEGSRRSTHADIENDGYYLQKWELFEHTGTHVDAPGHFHQGGRLSTDLTPAELITPAVVVDIAARASRDPDTEVTIADLLAYERKHGRIPSGAAVLMYSGWGVKSDSVNAYRGTDARGVYHFPGFSDAACRWLLENRAVRSLGVDTLSIDPGRSETFPVHLRLLGADRYGLENLANLASLPRRGATVFVGLIPYEAGSGGQARVIAFW